ncbi:hypothetical protein OS188_07350 [Xanthomarina sp. F1114]|uniref:DUF6617 family protein n=1 Tax=Xanthomarina sp. F1114 TaxID=2996019 RepID=UPI00225DF659|nr:DUF6617 family protein [Xanthomarina sp. F1114]MCX7547763.1 hypothetical protein [Xanthomarina sp. F1114]
MATDVFESLTSITKGLHRDNRTERDYKELYQSLNTDALYKAAPLFTIEFAEKPFGAKRKYYKAVIDNQAVSNFNNLIEDFPENTIEQEYKFNYQQLYNRYKHYLIDVKSYIDKHNLSRVTLSNENTYIIQYLKANMIWLFMELQERFSKYGNEDEMSIEEVYKYYFNEELNELEIKPSEIGKTTIQPKQIENAFTAIEDDLPHRTVKGNVLSYSQIVKYPRSLSRAEEMMFEFGIIDKNYDFIENKAKSNKTVLGAIYFLFIQKQYFNDIKMNPFKKIKPIDIVRFLNNRYNTNARKQLKILEGDDEKRNAIINSDYLLKNLPNQIR